MAGTGYSLSQTMRLGQTIAPQMRQSLKMLQMTSLELPRRQVAAQNAMKSGTRNVPCYSHKERDVPEHYIPDNTQPTP